DSFVPIVFAGSDVPAQHISRRVHTVDVAPTLSAYLKTTPPSRAVGTPLDEVIDRRLRVHD
ncbi:MAG: alkaline phosphatase family protein, partial [Gammaproteobacteria bacterium]|nr:alkaline phosphatase family protein [Gammaproteobacteria bacterium]